MASGLITSFLGEGLAASRPADPDVAGAIAFYWSTDTNEMSAWLENAWVEDILATGGALLAANNLSDLASAATARTNLGVAIGTDVQAYDADLADIAGIADAQGDIIIRGASGWERLAAGTDGQVLTTGGAGANPAWETPGSAAWALAGTGQTSTGIYDQAVDGTKANVDFVGLASYNELLVVCQGLTASVSGVRQVQVSVDNGSTFDTTAASYLLQAANGTEANAATPAAGYHSTNSTAARNLRVHITNLKGTRKVCISHAGEIWYVGSSSDINAIRVNSHNGGNITGGTVRVYAR